MAIIIAAISYHKIVMFLLSRCSPLYYLKQWLSKYMCNAQVLLQTEGWEQKEYTIQTLVCIFRSKINFKCLLAINMQLSVGSFTHPAQGSHVREKMVPSEGRGFQSCNFIFLFCLTLPGCQSILHRRSAEKASLVPQMVVSTLLPCQKSHQWWYFRVFIAVWNLKPYWLFKNCK